MNITSPDTEKQAALQAAFAMAGAVRTAPKGRGVDVIVALVLTEQEKDVVADRMEAIGNEKNIAFFKRDSANVRKSHALVLVGAMDASRDVPNCGYCGFPSCVENRAARASCAIAQIDLGIALGSAVSLAADLRVDTRIMFSAGKAAMSLGLMGDKVTTALGIPVSLTSKSIFFDRG